jgi:hypothetical protein
VSTYEDLCALYQRARARANERRERAAGVCAQAGDRIVRRLGVPDGAYVWRPADAEPDESSAACVLADVIHADEEGVWHAGMQILVRVDGEKDDALPIFFVLSVREDAGHFIVSMGDGDAGHRVDGLDSAALDALAADTERRLRAWFTENLDRMLGAAGPVAQFGQYL